MPWRGVLLDLGSTLLDPTGEEDDADYVVPDVASAYELLEELVGSDSA